MPRNPNERPIWLNPDKMQEMMLETSLEDGSVLMDLIMLVWAGDFEPIRDDWKWIANRMNFPALHKSRRMTEDKWERVKPAVERFFVKLADGRYVPSPDLVAVNDPNAEMPS